MPTNILTVSGLGETSVTKVITVLDVSVTPQLIQNGLKGEVKFVGERPIDMQMFGWYLDTDGFHCFEQDLETGEISDELSAGDCDDLQDEALPDLFIQRCFDINLIPTLDFTQIESILDKQQIQEIESPLKTNSIEICIDGTYTELAGDFFKDFKLLLNPIGQEFSEGGDFCEITEFGLDCDILFLNVADADPLIDAKTIKDILDFVTGIPSAASDTFTDITDDLGDLFDCIILDVGCA